MLIFETLAERRIREAQDNGDFDNLPGTGAPLALGDDALVPEELRAAYRLLKNAGYLPPELEVHREIRELEQLLRQVDDGSGRSALVSRIRFLLERAGGARRGNLRLEAAYYEKVAEKLVQRHSGPA